MKQHSETHAGMAHMNLRAYVVGFILSLILTVIPFWMVMNGTLPHSYVLYGIVIAAVVQIVVHLVCFLHLHPSSSDEWNLLALAFTLLIIGIVVIGSLWIMHHLNLNMMPT
ncbi:MAG: cytochrome o ubiquinol oxidase subunit IV [Enterobacteriaceae bacterium]